MESTSPYIQDVTIADFQQAVLQKSHDVPVVVDFWAEWCGPCRTLGPLLEKLADESQGAFILAKVDVDSNQDLAAQFNVQGIPTVIGFKGGMPIDQFTGALPEAAIRDWLERLLPSEIDLVVDQARDAAIAGNLDTAERLFSAALDQQPDHQEAGTGLAALMIASGRQDEALVVLGKLAVTDEVERLQSAARLSASRGTDISDLTSRVTAAPDDDALRIELALALAAEAEYEPALDHLLGIVKGRGPAKEDARRAMLDIFEVLGDGHPLTTSYRRQLASALF
ncbi:MAG: thioredoxin [Acidimicrobiia bacterium]|nr:thioredoxin [Acidimicrobiia bacterium]